MTVQYLVLSEGTSPEDVRGGLEDVWDELSGAGGPTLAYSHSEEEQTVTIDVWREARDGASIVRLSDDAELGSLHFEVEGGSADVVDRIAETLRKAFSVRSFEELVGEASARDAASIVRMALASPDQPHRRAIALIEEALRSDDPHVEEAAVVATALTRWGDLRPVLEQKRETADGARRDMIDQAIADLREERR